jgi:hypothetical protein
VGASFSSSLFSLCGAGGAEFDEDGAGLVLLLLVLLLLLLR